MDFLYKKTTPFKKKVEQYKLQYQVSNSIKESDETGKKSGESGKKSDESIKEVVKEAMYIVDKSIENKLNIEKYFSSLRQSKLSIRKYEPQKKREDVTSNDFGLDESRTVTSDIISRDPESRDPVPGNPERETKRTRKKPSKKTSTSVFVPPQTSVDFNSIKFFKFNNDENQILNDRLPKIKLEYSASNHHLNNRETFLNFINNTLFSSYLKDSGKEEEITCKSLNDSKSTGEFKLLLHQNLVKDYLNVYSPYRGLFLYFGLGAGKTCSSIAIAEGFNDKQIVVMTPASLQENYVGELKFCGNFLFKKNQFWEKIETNNNNRTEEVLSNILGLSLEDIKKNNGAWMIDVRKPSNYNILNPEHKNQVNKQINTMLRKKYKFINYNGLRQESFQELVKEGNEINDGNYFNNKVVIIDEVHNFVSLIVNKLKNPDSLSMQLYESLLDAENCRIIFLTGTPIINYPNEIGIFYNILRGYIKTYKFKLDTSECSERKIDENFIKTLLKKNPYDYIEYSSKNVELKITSNPFKFTNVHAADYVGVKNEGKDGSFMEISKDFIEGIIQSLLKRNIKIKNPTEPPTKYKCLPDDLKEFNNLFINTETKTMKNVEMFQRRIMGLTSFYKSASETLLPKFNKITDIIDYRIPMSSYQITVYEQARSIERKEAANNAKKMKSGLYEDSTSSYRNLSRTACNFVFPENIIKPVTVKKKTDKGEKTDESSAKETKEPNESSAKETIAPSAKEADEQFDPETGEKVRKKVENIDTINLALDQLSRAENNGQSILFGDNLIQYSPKFHKILENVTNEENVGLHLLYSCFKEVEGIAILKLVFEANGFVQFKLTKKGTQGYQINEEELKQKKSFALYTGDESTAEKELIRLIFNSEWDKIKDENLRRQLKNVYKNNFHGDIMKCLMITSSGAEGITLKNTRFVHIIEPYWHPVRQQQVIGRAVRICSHDDLADNLKNVKVFKYIMTFTNEQLYGDLKSDDPKKRIPKVSKELMQKDFSKYTAKKTIITTDEALDEISNIKETINKNILDAIKFSAIDCKVHNKPNSKEFKQCFTFNAPSIERYLYKPSYKNDETDKNIQTNKEKINWIPERISFQGKKFIFQRLKPEKPLGILYDYELFIGADENPNALVKYGELKRDPNNKRKLLLIRE